MNAPSIFTVALKWEKALRNAEPFLRSLVIIQFYR
jgi:hypothetical protein